MEEGSRGRALNASYSLRRRVVPSKRFEDFYLEKQHLSKKKNLQDGEKLGKKSEISSALNSSLSPVPMSTLSGDTLSCGDSSSAVPQNFPGSSLPEKNECASTNEVFGPTLPTIPEASGRVGHRRKQAKPCRVVPTIPEASGRVGHRRKQAKPCRVVPCEFQAEEDMEAYNVPLDIQPCSAEQMNVGSLDLAFLSSGQSQGETRLSSQTPMDFTPEAPKMKRPRVAPEGNTNDLKHRLEIAAMLLQLAQDVPALVPEVGCSIKLQGELKKIKKFISKGNKTTLKECSKTPKTISAGKHGQKRKHVNSLDSGPVKGPKWTAARDKEDMFFTNLEDSSLMAEAKERTRREAEQERSLQQMAEPLEDRYLKNAAVLPDVRPLPPVAPSPPPSSSQPPTASSEPLLIHGYTVEEYQAIYRSVVDPMMTTKSGGTKAYSLELGRAIKQRLFERLFCPRFVETADADGRVQITESHSEPTLKSFAPHIDVDISGEPLPEEPKRKRARR